MTTSIFGVVARDRLTVALLGFFSRIKSNFTSFFFSFLLFFVKFFFFFC
jgi:hypothetical protein